MAVWSGDMVVQDGEEGFLYFVGRKDDMTGARPDTGGQPEQRSKKRSTTRALVRDAVALGVEDPSLGQHIALVVSPVGEAEVDVDALLSQLREYAPGLPALPKRVDVRPESPRSPNGKFDRTDLRAELTA